VGAERRLAVAATAALLLGACDSFYIDSDGVVIIGWVRADVPVTSSIAAPDTVTAGEPFDAVVYSFGSTTCATPVRADVVMDGLVARVTPYVRVPDDPGTQCTADVSPRPHPVRLTFPRRGQGMIEAVGRAPDASGGGEETVVRRPVWVR
jgi:hypothetical protein